MIVIVRFHITEKWTRKRVISYTSIESDMVRFRNTGIWSPIRVHNTGEWNQNRTISKKKNAISGDSLTGKWSRNREI